MTCCGEVSRDSKHLKLMEASAHRTAGDSGKLKAIIWLKRLDSDAMDHVSQLQIPLDLTVVVTACRGALDPEVATDPELRVQQRTLMIWSRLSKWLLPNVKIIQPGCWSCHQHSKAASAISATCSKRSTPHARAFLHAPDMMTRRCTMEMCPCNGSCLRGQTRACFLCWAPVYCMLTSSQWARSRGLSLLGDGLQPTTLQGLK